MASSSLVVLNPTDEQEMRSESTSMVARVNAMVVATESDWRDAGELRKVIKAGLDKARSKFKPVKQAIDDSKKKVLSLEHEVCDPLEHAVGVIDAKRSDWHAVWEAARLEEQNKREAEAKRQAEEAALARAAELEAAGMADAALQELDAVEELPPPPPPPPLAKIDGLFERSTWEAVVTDNAAAIIHVASHPELYILLKWDMQALNRMARSLRGPILPGITSREKRGYMQR